MPAPSRILFYNHTRKVSGAERMLLMLLSVLDRTLYEPIAACPTQGDGNLDALLQQQGIETIPAPLLQARFISNPILLCQYLYSFATTILTFRRTVLKAAPALLHANSVRAGIVATIATTGTSIPVLWHIQDDLPAHLISAPIRLLAYASSRTRLVAVSAATARAFSGGLNFGTRLTVLHNAIDQTRFPRKTHPLDEEAASFRAELHLAPTDFLVVTVGILHPRKGLLGLVEAFSAVARQHPQAHLAIVGAAIFNDDHLYEQQLRTLCHRLQLDSRVHFTGPRHDVPAILRAADLFVLNATAEPFGLVLLEAISSGTPVIANEVGGIPEIIQSGVTGQLIPRNSDQLAATISNAIANPDRLAAMADAACNDVLPRFSLANFAAGVQCLYASLGLRKGAA